MLANLVKHRVPVIYMDEATFNSWVVKQKSWQLSGTPNLIHRDDGRFSVTVFGAISSALDGGICWMFGEATNATEY